MPTKPKKPQPETAETVQIRDLFETPNYAVDLLVPFIPVQITTIWECAAGSGRMTRRFRHHKFDVVSSDINLNHTNSIFNFLTEQAGGWIVEEQTAIVTNPPFSLKDKFYQRCKEYGIPFALLIPADYSGWVIDAVRKDGAEKIIPDHRINYITPDMCQVVFRGQLMDLINRDNHAGHIMPGYTKFKRFKDIPAELVAFYSPSVRLYESVYDIPNELIARYSASQFHSQWLTWGFGLGKSETFVELTGKMKLEIQ